MKTKQKKLSRKLFALVAAIAIGSMGALTSCSNNTQTGALVGGLGGAAIGGAAKGKKGAVVGAAAGAAGGALIGNHKDRQY